MTIPEPDDGPSDFSAGAVAGPPTVTITSLVSVDVRNAWPTEPGHFTPWLLDNAPQLSEVLGVEVELDDREHKVGTFSLDLIGRVAGSDQVVIVENQYGETDHRHLGQILTYAGGTEPAIIIWIAERFREEHRAALDWLNQNTHPDVRFFGIKLAAVRLQGAPEHLVAPRLELVCKPNDWEKLAKLEVAAASAGVATGKGPSSVNALYKRFWEKFALIAKDERGWTTGTPPAQNWWSLPTGIGTIQWTVSFATFGARSELYFGHTDPEINLHRLQQLRAKQAELQAAYGDDELIFDELPNNKATRIEVRLHGPKVTEEDKWDEVIAWMVDTQDRLRAAVAAVGGLPTSTP